MQYFYYTLCVASGLLAAYTLFLFNNASGRDNVNNAMTNILGEGSFKEGLIAKSLMFVWLVASIVLAGAAFYFYLQASKYDAPSVEVKERSVTAPVTTPIKPEEKTSNSANTESQAASINTTPTVEDSPKSEASSDAK